VKLGGIFKGLISESVVYSLASIFSRFIQILLIPLYTRILNPDDYGVLSVVVTVSSLISIVVGLQLDSSAFRWYVDSEEMSDRKKTFASWAWCQLTLSSILILLVWLFRTSLGNFILPAEATNIGNYLVISMATVLLGTFELVLLVLFRMERRKWAIFTILVSGLITTIALTIVFVVFLNLRL
jgi:O-antigen/teichoic acid export membrane protein